MLNRIEKLKVAILHLKGDCNYCFLVHCITLLKLECILLLRDHVWLILTNFGQLLVLSALGDQTFVDTEKSRWTCYILIYERAEVQKDTEVLARTSETGYNVLARMSHLRPLTHTYPGWDVLVRMGCLALDFASWLRRPGPGIYVLLYFCSFILINAYFYWFGGGHADGIILW